MSFVKTHIPCPDQDGCGSSDAASLDDRGKIFCFACTKTFDAPGGATEAVQRPTAKPHFSAVDNLLVTGDYEGCPERGISADTAKFYKALHTAEKTYYGYFSKDSPTQAVAIKMRYPNKSFPWVGDHKAAMLFGQQNFPSGGKYVTITEGEEDAMLAYQLMGSKYPVVSIRNGAQGAIACCKAQYEWLDSFDNIVICFDADKPGQAAAKEVAQLFGGKSKIMKHPEGIKDACEYYQKKRVGEFMQAFWRAERFTPDGIIVAASLRDKLKKPVPPPRWYYPWASLNKMFGGIREAELVTWTAGSGVGKSSMLREIVYSILKTTGDKVGVAFLEETPERTLRGIVGLHLNKRINLHGVSYSPEEIDNAYDDLELDDRLCLWEHWGSSNIDNVISRLKFFVKAMGCPIVILDHLSIVVSGEATNNERQKIDELMTRLRTEVVQATLCSLHVIVHLTRPDGKPLENGAPVTLSLLRGSGSIAQLSDAVIAGERDTQADDETDKNVIRLRGLKSREIGDTGVAGYLQYDKISGRLTELDESL